MLTKREKQIWEMVGEGATKQQIWSGLHISPRTLDKHFENLRGKLGFKSGLEMGAKAGQMLLTGELMATLESLIVYCPNGGIKDEATKRLLELQTKYK